MICIDRIFVAVYIADRRWKIENPRLTRIERTTIMNLFSGRGAIPYRRLVRIQSRQYSLDERRHEISLMRYKSPGNIYWDFFIIGLKEMRDDYETGIYASCDRVS